MPDLGGGYSMNPQLAQAAADGQQSAGKVSAADAKYQDAADNCGSCSHFQGDGQPCDVIVEPVSTQGWCSLYAEGQSSASPQQSKPPDISAAPAAPAPGAAQ